MAKRRGIWVMRLSALNRQIVEWVSRVIDGRGIPGFRTRRS